MRDDFITIASQTHAQTTLDIELCKLGVRDSWRELLQRNAEWSWLLKRGIVTLPTPYTTGLATFTQYSNTVTGSGTAWDASMIGRQIRSGIGDPFYTVIDVPSPTSLLITPAWADTTSLTPSAYSIFSAYLTVPDDFFSFVVVKDPQRSWRLNLHVDQTVLDFFDPKRSSTGQPVCLSAVDYSPSYAGKVYPAIQATGTGGAPLASGTYFGATDAVFVVQITSTGIVDVATFQWKKDNGAWTTGVPASSLGNILSEGVALTWPTGVSFTNGDVFVVRTSSVSNPGLPRYEIYPYPSQQTILHFQYLATYPDLDDPNVTLPRYIPGNVIKEGALAKVARIPGTNAKSNPYAQRARAENHEARFDVMISELMRQDQEVFCRSVQQDVGLPFAPLPWMFAGQPLDYDPPYIYPIYR
jgi:hypothetical protein